MRLPPRYRLDAPARAGLATTIVLLALTACGTDTPTDGGGGGTPVLALSSETESLAAFQGGPSPTGATIDVTNSGDGTLTGLDASVAYAPGQVSGWLTATLSGTTAPATLQIDTDIDGLDVGTYDGSVVVSMNGGAEQQRSIDVTLSIGLSSPPTIEITSPTRAAMLQEGTGDASDVRITGTACHDSVPIASLSVNGEEIDVAGTDLCESFDVTQTSPWGMSTIEVHAENAYGRAADAVQSYLRSPEYFPAAFASDPSARAPHALLTRLNAPVIDDGDRNDVDDFGTAVEAWINAFDVNGGLPSSSKNPTSAGTAYVDDCGLWNRNSYVTGLELARTGSLSVGSRTASLRASASGVEATVDVTNMSAPIRAEGWQDTGCLLPDLHAKQSGDLFISSVASSVLVEPRLIGPVLDLGTVDATTQVRGLSIDVDWGILDFLDFLVNGIVGSFSGTISSALQSNFDYFVEASLPDVLGDLLGSLELHRSATVNGSDVAYEGPLDTLKWGSDGSATLGLGVQVRPSGPAAGSADVSGAIRSASTGTPTWATSYDMGVAVSDDFLNQTLWAAWQAGSFTTDDVSASTGQTYAGLVGGLTPQLPPVVVAGSGEHILDVQWGDLVLEGTADPAVLGLPGFESGNPVEVEAHVSLVGGLDLGYDGENRVLEGWPGEPDVRVELHLAAGAVLDEAALRESIAAAVADYAEVALLGAVGAIPVPYVDLSGVDGVAAGTTVGLLSATITREGAYTKLTGPAGN